MGEKTITQVKYGLILIVMLSVAVVASMSACSDKTQQVQADAAYSNETVGSTTPELPEGVKLIESIGGSIVRVEYDDLYKISSLVVHGRVTEQSEEHLVQGVGLGDPVCFTDIYIEVEEVYRGQTDGGMVIVRVMGGSKSLNDDRVWFAPDEPRLDPGDDCVFFLHKPNYGGGYNTLGDYWLVVGVNQGVFYLGGDGQYHNQSYPQTIDLESFGSYMSVINQQVPIDYDYYRNYYLSSINQNYRNGVISEEQYNQAIEDFDVYAEIIK